MLRDVRPLMTGVLLLLAAAAAPADAQTRTLTVHVSGTVTVSGTAFTCTVLTPACLVYVNDGATIRLSAADATMNPTPAPGNFFGGTGPAAGCALSTCAITMTADAEVSVGPSALPVVKLTLITGAFPNMVKPDGIQTGLSSWTVAYLQGSSVELDAEPADRLRFIGYSAGTGDAAACGSASHCAFTINGNSSVTGDFRAVQTLGLTISSPFGALGGPPQTFTVTGTDVGGGNGVISRGKGTWFDKLSLPFPSMDLAAAGLGGKVYAMGGQTISFDSSSVTNQLAAYDPNPAAPGWTTLAPMLVKRTHLSAATSGGFLYALGGTDNIVVHASMERYDPGTNSWTMRASMSAPRWDIVAGSVNGTIYAAGGMSAGGTPVNTLEAYDPVSDTWTPRAPMPTPRANATGGVANGILYVVGGGSVTSPVSTVEAYDPASNTWTTRAPLPGILGTTAAAATVADGVLYVFTGGGATYAYDPVADSWSARAAFQPQLGGAHTNLAAASLSGIVYAIGGAHRAPFCCNKTLNRVEAFTDTLRWSSSKPGVAPIDQNGAVTPVSAGTTTIVANVGWTTIATTFSVLPPSTISLDAPANGSTFVTGTTLTIGGWALVVGVQGTTTGVDAIHVYALPAGGGAIFLGVAPYGGPRPDVAAIYGAQFTNSGFTLFAGSALPAGAYTIAAFPHNAMTGLFDAVKTANIQIVNGVSNGLVAVDTPAPNQVLRSSFAVGGWAIDMGAPSGTGVDAVQFYLFPNGAGPGVLVGQGSYGAARPDVGALFGSRFTNSGYNFIVTGVAPGAYALGVYAHSTVTNAYSLVRMVPFTVVATTLMSIDTPGAGAAIAAPTFLIGGWAIDRGIESTGLSGVGVDVLHVYGFPNPGSGTPPIFLGVATTGAGRPDVGAVFGARYTSSGYNLVVDRAALGLAPGVYDVAVVAHSTVSGTFDAVRVVRVTLQ